MAQQMNRIKSAYNFVLDRLGEASTWQAIGFAVALFSAHGSGFDWGQGAALGGLVSAFIKTVTKG
jgi:hypothetical protein